MKRETIEVVQETLEEGDEGEPGTRFLLPSGFSSKLIQVYEDPFDLEVKYVKRK